MLRISSIRLGKKTLFSNACLFLIGVVLFSIVTMLPVGRPAMAESTVLLGSSWLSGSGVDVMSGGDNTTMCVPVSGAAGGNGCPQGSVDSGYKWQCVELVSRLYLTQGWIKARWSGNGDTLINNIPSGLSKEDNDHISSVNVGDAITYSGPKNGHVAIVNSSSGDTADMINQNATLNSTSKVSSGSLSNGNATLSSSWTGYAVQAIVHHSGSVLPPPPPPPGDGGGNGSSWAQGRIDAFIRGTDDRMWQKWVDSAGWHDYVQDPGTTQPTTLTSQIAAVSWGINRIDLFARSQSGSLIHKWLDGGGWSTYWEDLGGCIVGAPTVSTWGPNRLDIFAQSCNGTGINMVHKWLNTTWQPWEVVPNISARISSSPSAVSWGPNRIDIFSRGTNGDVIHNWYDGAWHDIDSQGGCIIGQPEVSSWKPGRLDVFGQTCNDTGANVWYKTYDNNAWQSWQAVPLDPDTRITSLLGAISWAPDRIDLFARGTDATLFHKWYDHAWNNWESKGGGIAQ